MNLELVRNTLEALSIDLTPESVRHVQQETIVSLDNPDLLPKVLEGLLKRRAFHHLSTITGQDDGQSLTVLYHLWGDGGLTIQVACDRRAPSLPTIEHLIPAEGWYEREVHDMLGIAFRGSKDQRPLVLPDDWDSEPPLLATSQGQEKNA